MTLNQNKELSANTAVSHYRILSKLGAGGMGEVWLAEDTRLGRKVALKLLLDEFTENSDRVRRFTQEAKAASSLNHPNIISIYDIGECERGRFIVMEFVAGHTLRSAIAKDTSLETFLTLGSQMARGLSAAHAAGITHRDIKPDNIMVRDDGYVKILDFGLARLLPTTSSDPEAATLVQETTPGTVMGTFAYMSPEQASGQPAGSSSDVFALGIVLYELATGSHPFKSETMIGYLHAITSQTPPSMTSIKSHLPVTVDDLVQRMLEKDANSRPTAGEVAQALQEIEKFGTGNALPTRTPSHKARTTTSEKGFWVAVLPFKFTGSNPDVASLCEGLTEEIVTGLSRFSYLRVISRSSTLRYSTEASDIRTIGTTLGARYVMEGSLRLAGSLLRLSVQLVDAMTGAHIWVESYNRSFTAEQVFELQDDLASRIVATVADMNGVLLHTMGEVLRQRDPHDLTPYEAVLRGLAYISRADADEHLKVRAALERAVVEAPEQSDCWSVLSMSYCDEDQHGFNVQPNSLDRALTAAQRATACGPANHLAHFSLASALFFRRDLQSFSIAADRAITLNPMDATTTTFLGTFIAYSGDWERGCALAEKGMDLNPNHPGWFRFTSYFKEYFKRDYRAALDVVLKMNMPGYYFINAALAAAYGQLGEFENARLALRELLKQVPNFGQTAREGYEKWFGPGRLVEEVLDGLRKAGLEIAEVGSVGKSSRNT
jgi:serine/threonine-protein kinase